MTEPVRVWLVDREYTDRGLIRLVYATPDGERALQRERAATIMHREDAAVTAAVTTEPGDLEPVDDAELRERYAAEASRVADRNDPDDPI